MAEETGVFGQWVVSGIDEEINVKEYKTLRDDYFGGEGYVEWDENALLYAIKENQICNGKTLLLSKETSDGSKQGAVFMYRIERCRLHVMETTLEDKELQDMLPELLAITNTTAASAGNMGGMILLPERLRGWECSDGYLGLTLG